MSTIRISSNETFFTDVSVRESDKYTESVLVRFDRNHIPSQPAEYNEMFLTPLELEALGKFFISCAEEIKTAQTLRK